MRRLLAVIALAVACSACGHHQNPPAPTTSTTSDNPVFPPTTDTTTPTTTQTCTYDCSPSVITRTPFENPPDSSGIGKG